MNEQDNAFAATLPPLEGAAFSDEIPWDIPGRNGAYGAAALENGRLCIGRVGAPPGQEANSQEFCFWIPEDALVEATQIVTVKSRIGGHDIEYQALIEEVHRSSRRRGMGQEVDEYDGDVAGEPLFSPDGITYATATILRADPAYLTPPRERSAVLEASEEEACKAYGAGPDEMENRLAVGLIKNGGEKTAGPGYADLDYLLGANGGHLNVNGAAGRGTKSSFLLHITYLLLAKARREQAEKPSDPERLRVVPIIFNVKGYDLFHIDRASSRYDAGKHSAAWAALGIDHPGPFENVSYFAPQQQNNSNAAAIPGRGTEVLPYSWGLQDLIEKGLFWFLFASDETMNDNFQALILDLEDWLTDERPDNSGRMTRHLSAASQNAQGGPVNTLESLSVWTANPESVLGVLPGGHVPATVKKLSRRLRLLALDSRGVLRRNEAQGSPLVVTRAQTCDPMVIDLNGLAGSAWLQRFVVATVLRQLVDAQTYQPVPGLKYLVVLDELNRFAPKGGRDAITKLVELVASEMRSQGVLLFGAQQQASLVSEKLIENAGLRAVGKTGTLELSSSVWRGLSQTDKGRADSLPPDEKLLLQDSFRKPMHIRVPFPAWAMRRGEAVAGSGMNGANGNAHQTAPTDD